MSNADGGRSNDHQRSTGWQECAAFIVYIEKREENGVERQRTLVEQQCGSHRTDVHHIESGEHCEWPGIALHDACDWMLHRLAGATEASGPACTPGPDTLHSPDLRAIERICLVQPGSAGPLQILFEHRQALAPVVEGARPFSIDVTLGPAMRPDGSRRHNDGNWEVSVLAQEIATWRIVRLGEVEVHEADPGRAHEVRVIVPGPLTTGSYRLRVVARHAGRESACELPLLRVL